jgi:predicted fused transcriptional regulator/phosphomethylpyrimidine kinase/predicted transcriptional regulator
MVSEFLPNMRGLVSHELHDRGESQRKIATLLGITQARVSYYLGIKKGRFVSELASKFALSQSEVQSYGRILSEDVRRSEVDGIFTLYSIWRNMLFTGGACSIHQEKMGVSSDCSVCMELHRPYREGSPSGNEETEDSKILREVSDATALIESSAAFSGIMPEVSVNIAMSRKAPKSSRDVAAIPGRINRIHGRAKALMLPEFGSSKHMSNVLIILNSKDPSINSVLNLKYDKSVDKIIAALGIARIFTQAEPNGGKESRAPPSLSTKDPVVDRLSRTMIPKHLLSSASPFAIVDRGSAGVEPMTYLVGRKATDVAQSALKIAHDYVRAQLESS